MLGCLLARVGLSPSDNRLINRRTSSTPQHTPPHCHTPNCPPIASGHTKIDWLRTIFGKQLAQSAESLRISDCLPQLERWPLTLPENLYIPRLLRYVFLQYASLHLNDYLSFVATPTQANTVQISTLKQWRRFFNEAVSISLTRNFGRFEVDEQTDTAWYQRWYCVG